MIPFHENVDNFNKSGRESFTICARWLEGARALVCLRSFSEYFFFMLKNDLKTLMGIRVQG